MIILNTKKEALEVFHFVEKELGILCRIIEIGNRFRIKKL